LREIKVLQSKIEELGAQIQSPATDMANQIVSNLQDALKEMMTDLNGATRKELEEIGRLLNASSGSLTQFPKHMEAVLASVQLIADEIKTATGNAVTEMSKELGVINERQVNLVDSQSDIMEKTTVLLDRFDNTVNSLQEFTLENRDSIVELREFHAQFVASGTSVEGASRSLADNLQNLQNAQKLLAENISQLSANTKESLQQMSESFETVEAKLDKQNTNFVQITNSLDNVFRQINNGLRDYQATVQSTMENFLKTYSEALTDTAKALNGTAGLQRDTISEIQEVVSILKDKDAQ
jgi:seryl-tRNA synthetase